MIWCRFEVNGKASYGIVDNEMVTAVDGSPFEAHTVTSVRHRLDAVKLLLPVVPATFYCVGINYSDHIIKSAKRRGVEPVFPPKPDIGYRANNALIAHGEDIVKPADSGDSFQYEGELVAVIGKQGKYIPKERALEHVFGWTIGNDVSERTWQRNDRTMWRAKNADTFKPMGPWIVTGLDYRPMTTIIRLNGTEVDRFATANMIFDVETYISEITKYITLYPGDVIWMGTDGLPQNMKVGDVCEIEIPGIGVLRNPVVAERRGA
jgi:2-keto-4-pentenoate hydratase/2-oxohepta-3-ene-1,7-dioic acid hydratase in catechol pathway